MHQPDASKYEPALRFRSIIASTSSPILVALLIVLVARKYNMYGKMEDAKDVRRDVSGIIAASGTTSDYVRICMLSHHA